MKVLKVLMSVWVWGYVLFEILIPYPRPNYRDPDLISKEVVNGTLAKVLRDDIAHFRAPGDRYATSADDLIAQSLARRGTKPQDLSYDIEDNGIGGLKEMAWLPMFAEAGECRPRVVYDPKKLYNDFAYIDEGFRLPVPYTKGLTATIPHYDPNDPGLWGGYKRTDDDGHVTECKRGFFSFSTGEFRFLVDVPKKICDGSLWINSHLYIKGGLIFVAVTSGGKQLMSLDMDGRFHELSETFREVKSLGDFGYVAAATTDGRTKILNEKLETVQELDGNYLSANVPGEVSGQQRYRFGAVVNGAIYYAKDADSSYKWWKKRDGVGVKAVKSPIWRYNTAVKYDYVTNEYTAKAFKTIDKLHYNKRRGCFQPKLHLPKHEAGDKVYFAGWDGFGDFVTVQGSDGKCRVWHTYDFKKWELAFDNRCELYDATERMWFKRPAFNGLYGFTPLQIIVRPRDTGAAQYMELYMRGIAFYYR